MRRFARFGGREQGETLHSDARDLVALILGDEPQQFDAIGRRQAVEQAEHHERHVHWVFGHLRHIFEQDMAVGAPLLDSFQQTLERGIVAAGQVAHERRRHGFAQVTLEDQRGRRTLQRCMLAIGDDGAQWRHDQLRGQQRAEMADAAAHLAACRAKVALHRRHQQLGREAVGDGAHLVDQLCLGVCRGQRGQRFFQLAALLKCIDNTWFFGHG